MVRLFVAHTVACVDVALDAASEQTLREISSMQLSLPQPSQRE